MTDPTTDRHTCSDRKAAAGPAWKCPRCSAVSAVSLPPADQTAPTVAEAVLAAVEAALCDELVPTARAEALARIAAVLPATTDQTAVPERRERYKAAIREADGWVLDDGQHMVDAVMAVADAEINEHREIIAGYRRDSAAQYQLIAELERENARLRRMADETQPAEAEAQQPRRGDQFEAWLKRERDDQASDRANDHTVYDALDDLLDLYRLHADTGTPLDGHVCEAKVLGDCECLEQPAAGATPVQHAPGKAIRCPDCRTKGYTVCRNEPAEAWNVSDARPGTTDHTLTQQPAAGARQDGAQPNPREVCICGHTRSEHGTVSGRLLCGVCDPDSTENLACQEFEAL